MQRTETKGRGSFIDWLAESYRNNCIAVAKSFHIGADWPSTAKLRSQVSHLGYGAFDLPYEPRSLTVSAEGGHVAVGTKAGEVRVAAWDSAMQTWKLFKVERKDLHRGEPSAIRGLSILGGQRLVAAWGWGGFGIVDIAPNTEEKLRVLWCDQGRGRPSPTYQVGPGRFGRLIQLIPPESTPPDTGDLILSVTRGGYLYLLGQGLGGAYNVRAGSPHEMLPQWEMAWGRPVDGGWMHGHLWLLSSRGYVVRYKPAALGEMESLVLSFVVKIQGPHDRSLFRGLDICEVGIALLAAESVAFLWFDWPQGEEAPTLDAIPSYWFQVPGAMDCAVSLPYLEPSSAQEMCNAPVRGLNPVWTVVSTAEPGLRWIAWENPRPQSGRLPSPWAAPGNFILAGGGSVLYVKFGRPGPGLPPFIACSTRDHKLVIASILDRPACEQELALHSCTDASQEILPERAAGMRWWYLLQQARATFAAQGSEDEAVWLRTWKLLECVDRSNLRSLASRIVQWRWESRRPDADTIITQWAQLLLRRAHEFGPDVAKETAVLLVEKLQRLDEHHGGAGQLGSLVAFIQKWIVYGHTYSEKISGILHVYKWNFDCRRNLDALVYLTRLLHQEVDHLWEVTPPTGPWTPSMWSLASASDGEITIISLADGALCAVSVDGRLVPWGIGPDLPLHGLKISGDGLRLEREDSEDFEKKYHHGPYARSIWLADIQRMQGRGSADYLLVFCLKGWRRQDREEEEASARPPIIYALCLSLQCCPDGELKAVIEDLDSEPVESEIYALCEIDRNADSGAFTLVAGSTPEPFIEFDVKLGDEGVSVVPKKAEVRRFEEGERSVFRQASVSPEAAYNPCWAIVGSKQSGSAPGWIWAGFQDGFIRGYQRHVTEGKVVWTEGGVDGPRQSGIQLTGAIWRLLALEGPGKRNLLAFGTGEGVVGAVYVDDLHSIRDRPIGFMLHSRESTPICGLVDYIDMEDDKPRRHLMAVTQGGVACIFSLDFHFWSPSEEPSGGHRRSGLRFHFPGLRVDRFRLGYAVRALSCIEPSQEDSNGQNAPLFLLGGADGRIHKVQMEFPRYSARRRRQVESLDKLLRKQDGDKGRPIGDIVPAGPSGSLEWMHQWLRVLHVGEGLLRFSLWDELRQAGDPLWNEENGVTVELVEERFDRFKRTVERLATETYRRRPFSKEPAKMLWSEAGRIASALAFRALAKVPRPGIASDPLVRIRLQKYLELNVLASDLCNRWIGVEQALEATVLIHSFGAFFDWTAIVLIAADQDPEEDVEKIRRFLVDNLIQRRLNFADPLVPLETMRIINASILRAIVNNLKERVEQRTFRVVPRHKSGGSAKLPASFFALMALVGDLWERFSGSLHPSDPLLTEIVRFFSLSLLLVPDGAILIGQVVSESRLTEAGTGLAHLIHDQAEKLRKDMQGEGCSETPADLLGVGLARFSAYIDEKADFSILALEDENVAPGMTEAEREESVRASSSWSILARQARRLIKQNRVDFGDLSDEGMLVEQYYVMQAAAWLSDLDRQTQNGVPEWFAAETKDELLRLMQDCPEGLQWLLSKDSTVKFFTHSWAYLRGLALVRQDIRYLAQLAPVYSPENSRAKGRERSIDKAIELCSEILLELPRQYIFRPQRDHYEQLVLNWRDQLVKRGAEAITVLEVLDQFNRHVYRTSADYLMDSIVDLGMQVAPFSFGDDIHLRKLGGPLRLFLRERLSSQPLVQQVFETGERLVESTHLAGTLLTVAQDYVGRPGELGRRRSPISRDVGMDEIRKSVNEAARRMGIRDEEGVWLCYAPGLMERKAPGSRVIWDLFATEFARNIAKHACVDEATAPKPERILMRAGAQMALGKLWVLMSANVPYLRCLAPEARKLFESMRDQGQAEKAVNEIESNLAGLLNPHARGDHSKRGSGMGLYMISKIAGTCDIQTELKLCYPDWDQAKSYSAVQSLEAALCLCLSWEVRDE